MFKNHLRTAFRNLVRGKGYTFINIAGLAAGMAVCLLIGLYIGAELSYDRFHQKADRLFVLKGHSLQTPYSLATVLQSVADVEQTARLWKSRTIAITRDEEQFDANLQILLSEPSFFDLFSFPAVAGTPATALNAPGAAVVTESMAHRFFGAENPIGKTLMVQRSGPGDKVNSVTIAAVVKDPPPNSSIQFDLVAPLSSLGADAVRENQWGFDLFETYVQVSRPLPADEFSARIAEAMKQHLGPDSDVKFSVLPLTALHLSGLMPDGLKGQPKFLYIFGTIAVFVLLIAAVNFINLVTVQATKRIREVGIRKTIGASRFQLIASFVTESMLLSIAALLLSLWLAALALPEFSKLFDMKLSFWGPGYSLPLLAVVVLLLAMLSSIYPAFVISHFQPTRALRGIKAEAAPARTFGLRQALVVLQFVISVSLMVGTAVIYYQLDYVQDKDLGFDGEQVVIVNLGARMPASVREALRQRILSHSGVVSTSIPNAVPDRFMMGYTRPLHEAAPQSQVALEGVKFRPAVVDYDFIPTLKIRMLAGRNFSRDFATDNSTAYILNKAAAEHLGWSPVQAVGKVFKLGTDETPVGEIIGVVDDFHIESLHQAIAPVVLQLHTNSPAGSIPFVLAARLVPGQIRNAIADIRQEFNQIAPSGTPFQYSFLDDRFAAMYLSEQRLSEIIMSFSALAIFIACLGLFGLVAYTAEIRTREVGVRKILGASLGGIVGLLSKDFVKLVLIANLIAWPIAYFTMSSWLEDFAYRIDIGWSVFLLSGGVALLIALLTVSSQAIRAALANPVESLRCE